MVSAAEWEEARRYLPVIRRLAENPARTRADVVAGAHELGCGPTHTYAFARSDWRGIEQIGKHHARDKRQQNLMQQNNDRRCGRESRYPK